jgi:hypothetical protein
MLRYVPRRGRVNQSAINALEQQLIELAYAKNPDELLNIAGARREWQLQIHGVLNPNPGKPSKAASGFKQMIGL